MSKTIKQIADEIGVSKTAVRKKMAVLFTDNTGNRFAETVSGVVYITVSGESLIKQAFLDKLEKSVSSKLPETKPETISYQVSGFNIAIETLTKQLEQKDIQLAEKDKQIERLQQALSQQQQLHQTDQIKTLQLTDGNKNHWWPFSKKREKD